MRILYHYKMSAFSRRTRLALAHKGLDAELREGRATPAFAEDARKIYPLGTMPVLVDDGLVVGDSTAITHYLDRAYPEKPLWPAAPADFARAVRITALVDGVLNTVVDLGTRYYAFRNDAAWALVTSERLGRADKALAEIEGAIENRMYSASNSWSVSDIWVTVMGLWISGLPARAGTTPAVAQILSLGLKLPPGILAFTDKHRARPEIAALDTAK